MTLFTPKSRNRMRLDALLDKNHRDTTTARSQLAGAAADLARLSRERDGLLDELHAEVERRGR